MATVILKIRCFHGLKAFAPPVSVICQNSTLQKQIPWHLMQERKLCIAKSKESIETASETFNNASNVFRTIDAKNPKVYLESEFTALHQYLTDLGIKPLLVEGQFMETPDLLNYPLTKWMQVCDLLTTSGLQSEDVFKSIAIFPYLLKAKIHVLEQNIKAIQDIHIGRHSLLQIVQRYPELYVFPPKSISRRIRILDSAFPPENLKLLVKNNPNVLTDNWNSVSEKLMYIHKEMGLEQPHIAETECLKKSLLHIKTRHQFLLRAGLYTKPNLLRDKLSYKRNPPLTQIMDTSNKYFVNKVARLSEYEYDVFCNMMKEEHNDDESDDESDMEEENLEFE